jgi:anthranilate 1,2-dioxygenase small subunit
MDLADRIHRTNAAYARAIDNDELERWPEFFTDECRYRITNAENHRLGYPAGLMYGVSRGMLTDRVTALRQANIYERQVYRHLLGQPAILAEVADGAESETPFTVVRVMRDGSTSVFASGRYFDRWRVEGAEMKLAERLVVCDSSRVDTLIALPL